IGLPLEEMQQGLSLQPVTSTSTIRGTVIHVDRYDNVIVNVEKDLFYKIGNHRPFELYFKRHDPILQLSKYYHDVPVGEVLCLFNTSDLLEIAINMGKASTLLGLKVDDAIQIDFHS
ncbi:MAG: SAM-dependent chlorinase/fluorinase, partial [Phaeodactylibacter sp.]|nr:SAM-dependent chlorinase/fluorinase [Phaeodactylibacter sp.]